MIIIIQFTLISVSFPNFPGKVLGKTDDLMNFPGNFPGKHKISNFSRETSRENRKMRSAFTLD